MLTGSFILLLPFIVQFAERSAAVANAQPPASAAKRQRDAFSPVDEAWAALKHVRDHYGALLRVVAPWLLICCALPMIVVIADWKSFAERGLGSAVMVLLGLNLLSLAELALLCVAMIQWTRFTATGPHPRLTAFPGRALWGWAWRGLIFAPLLVFVAQIEPWARTHLPDAPQWQLAGLVGVAGFVVLVLLSPLALVLSAVALEAPDKSLAASMRGYRLVGRKFLLGAATILAPYALATWRPFPLYDDANTLVAIADVTVSNLLLFGVALVATTYLTRIYLLGANLAGADQA